jgi:TP901 family phage tail tape measure protein
MQGVIETLRIVYIVDVADKATKPLLASERAVQKSVVQTSRALAQQDAAMRRSAVATSTAAARKTTAHAREAKASGAAASSVAKLTRAERATVAGANRAAAAATKAAAANDKLAVSARKAEAAQSRAARRRPGVVASTGNAAASARSNVGLAAGVIGAVGISQAIKFDRALRNVNSIAGLTEKQLQNVGVRLRAMATDTAQGPVVLAEALYDLVSSGFDANESLVILHASAKAATAGLTDAATSTKAVAAVLNAYHRPAKDAAQISDDLFQTVNAGVISFEQLASTIGDVLPFASSLGVGLDQVGASVATLTKAGISPEETMTRIKNVMVTMLKPGDDLSATFKKLGVDSGEALIKQKGFQGALEAIVGSTDGTKAAVAKLFPNIRSLGGALALTGKNLKGAESDLDSFKNTSGATNKALAEQTKSTAYQWEKAKANAQALGITVGNTLLPKLNSALKTFTNLPGPVKIAMGAIAGGALVVGPINKLRKNVLELSSSIVSTGRRAAKSRIAASIADGAAGAGGKIRRALAGVPSVVSSLMRRAGLNGGATAADAIAGRMRGDISGALTKRQGAINGKFRGIGSLAGKAFGVAAAAMIAIEVAKSVPALDQYSGSKGWGELWRDLKHRVTGNGGRLRTPGAGRVGGIVGRLPRFQDGGLVPILASGGEMLVDGGRASMIPGPSDRDATPMLARPGAVVLTGHGQSMMAGGASLTDAVRGQLPHFAKGGRVLTPGAMASLAYRAGVRPGGEAIRMGAIGMRESSGRPGAHNYDPPRDDSWGLWQINVLPNANPRFKSWKLTNPTVNARAMAILHKAVGEKPWGGYSESSFSKWIPAARSGFTRSGKIDTAGSAADRTVALSVADNRRRANLTDDPFGAGITAGREGLTRSRIAAEGNPLFAALREAQSATTRTIAGTSHSSRATGGANPRDTMAAGVTVPRARWNPAGKPIAKWIVPYLKYAGAHGWPGAVTSGWRSLAEQTRIYNSGVRPAARPGSSNHEGSKFPRGAVDVTRATAPQLAQILNRRPGRHLLRFAGAKDPVHFSYPHGGSYRAGGIVGSLLNRKSYPTRAGSDVAAAPGAALTSGLARAMSMVGGSLEALDTVIGRSVEGKLLALREQIAKSVKKGGSAKTIQRLQATMDLIDFELGRRVGRILDTVEQRTAQVERTRGVVDRSMRKHGIEDDSAQGIGVMATLQAQESTVAKQNVTSLTSALRRAKNARNPAAIKEITQQLKDAQDALDESVTKHGELLRDGIRAAAQETVNTAQFALAGQQGSAAGLEAQQRLARTQDTAGGMAQRASYQQAVVVPALAAAAAAAQQQASALASIGDVNGWRQAMLDAQAATTDLATAQADAADMMREATARAAQDRVDAATHGRTMGDLALQRLELEQQLVGTHDSTGGAQGRADFIRRQILPAIQAEIDALVAQQLDAQSAGNSDLATQIAEAIYAKQNDVLQAQLDAQQQTASNTDALKEFGGSAVFSYRDQMFTDLDVIRARVGA